MHYAFTMGNTTFEFLEEEVEESLNNHLVGSKLEGTNANVSSTNTPHIQKTGTGGLSKIKERATSLL